MSEIVAVDMVEDKKERNIKVMSRNMMSNISTGVFHFTNGFLSVGRSTVVGEK